jgi:hypothetical protein
VASHGYVRSMTDWTYVSATHHTEKPDSVKKPSGRDEIWPPSEDLREITTIAYSHLAEYMEDWAKVSSNSTVGPFNQTADDSLAAGTASMNIAGESSQAGAEGNEESVIVDIGSDTYVQVVEKDGNRFQLRLLDNSTIKTQATGWQEAYVLFEQAWKPCYLYIGRNSGARYWTWTLEVSKNDRGQGKRPKGKG